MADVRLTVNGKAYEGWTALSIERGIEQISGAYELKVSEAAPDGSAATDIVPGARAQLSIDGVTITTGYIDELAIEHDYRDHVLTVRGRDAAGDLVDSGAIYGTGQWNDQGMLQIAKDLVAPFNMPVAVDTDLGAAWSSWNIEPGETVFENLDRMARHRGVLIVSDGRGGIRLTKPGVTRAPTDLVLGQNILKGDVTLSYRERFSEYIVLGQMPNSGTSSQDVSQPHGSAKDNAIKRYRPNVELIEDNGDNDTLKKRAEWRRNVNAGRGTRAKITVQGWKHAQGLWQPNTLVNVDDRLLRLEKVSLLIVGVKYSLDDQGTTTELTLAPAKAFTPEQLPDAGFSS